MREIPQNLFWKMRLENTRLLVKGIERLHQGYQNKLQQEPSSGDPWQLDELQKFVSPAYEASLLDDEHFLAQSPYAELFQFRYPNPPSDWNRGTESLRLSGMILLYHQLQRLEDIPADQLAEAYETICDSIRSIVDADMCYIASRHLTDTHLLCASSVKEQDLNDQLSSKDAGALLDVLKEPEAYSQLVEDVFLKTKPDNAAQTRPARDEGKEEKMDPADILVLPISLYDKKGTLFDQQAFLICQRWRATWWCDEPRQTFLQVRDTLFLRGQLAQALVRDLASLLSMAREFRNIRRKGPDPQSLQILHISDLHIAENNYRDIIGHIQQLKPPADPFDFLVITGDVIQGRLAAGDLEAHYHYAAKVIRALAFRIWGETRNAETVLPQDWKRRTIIIPGNHDYASMNELETQHGESQRASEGGRPAAQEGSAMAKFTYYIDFIRTLLDVEIGDLIDNSLNELRCYDKMGVSFLCCNTSIMANPARNNKVHLDEEFVHRACRQSDAKQPVIFLGHHGPDYTIDYVSDEYLEPLICKKITQDFVAAFSGKTDAEQMDALRKLDEKMSRLELTSSDPLDNDFIQTWLLKGRVSTLPPQIEDQVVARRKETRLYRHLRFLLEQMERGGSKENINERYQKILAEVRRAALLSENDQKAYDKLFSYLDDSLKPVACLSGHIHDWSLNAANHHYVASRFYSERMVQESTGSLQLIRRCFLNYGICKITKQTSGQKIDITYEKVEAPCG